MLRKAARGFTLIELMIVVAIIGILASIAIPNFLRYQLRSKSGEAAVNLGAIKTNEIAYFGSYDTYAEVEEYPAESATGARVVWDVSAATGKKWDRLGWKPEGSVYFSYGVKISGTTAFAATATANLDAAAPSQCWGYFKVAADADAAADAHDTTSCPKPTDAKYKNVVMKFSPDGEY